MLRVLTNSRDKYHEHLKRCLTSEANVIPSVLMLQRCAVCAVVNCTCNNGENYCNCNNGYRVL